jgi:hypothetical protein
MYKGHFGFTTLNVNDIGQIWHDNTEC